MLQIWISLEFRSKSVIKMAGAAGGFVTRAFESMHKESSAKKFTALQSAIQSYLGSS